MRKGIVVAMVAALFMVAGMGAAYAEVVLKDDIVFGFDSIILDVDNQREFLRLDFTAPYTYAEVVNEFGSGGAFEGWRVASQVDMDMLGDSANIVLGSTDLDMVARAEMLRDWFGEAQISSTHNYTRGLVSDFVYPSTYNGERAQIAFSIGVRYAVTPVQVSFRASGYAGETHRIEKIFLTRHEVGTSPLDIDPSDNCDASAYPTNPNCDQICIPNSKKEKGKKCSDGIDNDCDGFIDEADSDCAKKNRGKN